MQADHRRGEGISGAYGIDDVGVYGGFDVMLSVRIVGEQFTTRITARYENHFLIWSEAHPVFMPLDQRRGVADYHVLDFVHLDPFGMMPVRSEPRKCSNSYAVVYIENAERTTTGTQETIYRSRGLLAALCQRAETDRG